MANLTKSLVMPNGQEYEFVGKHWYGTCPTAAASQNKLVTISGFTNSDLVAGTKVTISFGNGNTYSGQPKLNISSTGNYYIARRAYGNTIYEYGGNNEWEVGAVITFTFNGTYWVIDNGESATTSNYGKTKLSNSIANDQTLALTPKAVYDAGYVNASQAADAAPVQSVNGQTGAVSLTIPTVPTDVSAFNNDAGYLTLANLPIWDGGVTP